LRTTRESHEPGGVGRVAHQARVIVRFAVAPPRRPALSQRLLDGLHPATQEPQRDRVTGRLLAAQSGAGFLQGRRQLTDLRCRQGGIDCSPQASVDDQIALVGCLDANVSDGAAFELGEACWDQRPRARSIRRAAAAPTSASRRVTHSVRAPWARLAAGAVVDGCAGPATRREPRSPVVRGCEKFREPSPRSRLRCRDRRRVDEPMRAVPIVSPRATCKPPCRSRASVA
jgi:hypothetical protein